MTLQDLSDQIALHHDISTTTLRNLVYYESRWNPNAVDDGACSYGLTQQNLCVNTHITKEQALDPVFALTTAARDIKEDRQHRYTPCSC